MKRIDHRDDRKDKNTIKITLINVKTYIKWLNLKKIFTAKTDSRINLKALIVS